MRKLIISVCLLLVPGIAWGLKWTPPEFHAAFSGTTPDQAEHLRVAEAQRQDCPDLLSGTSSGDAQSSDDCPDANSISDAQSTDTWTIGNIELFADSEANPDLEISSNGRSSLQSYNFAATVGGANFELIATPATEVASLPIDLAYNAEARDGNRLEVQLGGTTARPELADWLLVPIAQFAESEFTAAVSLFGGGPDPETYYYIRYHPAFADSLLGLRLLQADILLMDVTQNRSLPERNGKVILGQGETLPQRAGDQDIVIAISNTLEAHAFSSWILTDTGTRSSFQLNNEQLQISSSPYYYFWIRNDESVLEYREKANELSSRAEKYNERVAVYESRVNEFNRLVTMYNDDNATVQRATLDRLLAAIQSDDSDLKVMRQALERIKAEIEKGARVDPVQDLTNALIVNSHLVEELNPTVHAAVNTTAAYAAFFRHVKANYPGTWRTFLESIADVEVHPVVNLPTRMARPGSTSPDNSR